MSRRTKTSSSVWSRIAVVLVLGAGLGTALGALLANVPLGIGFGVLVGGIVAALWTLILRLRARR